MRKFLLILLLPFIFIADSGAAVFQFKLKYYKDNAQYGDLYMDVGGNTPSSLQAALTDTLTQTSLSNFLCKTSQNADIPFNAPLSLSNTCRFSMSNVSGFLYVDILAIASGEMTGNILTGTSGVGTNELPFDGLFASGVFAFFFSFVVGIWFFTKNIGLILLAIKRW